jgi:diguanylate cyclase (GGDEF)-like protein
MRIIRMAALIGSLVLLVGTMISILNRRDDLSDEYDLQLRAASVLATNAVENAVERASAVATVAGAETGPEALEVFAVPVDACVVSGGSTSCSGSDLTALAAFHTAQHAAGADGEAVAVIDGDSASVLVVGGGSDHTVVLRLPPGALLTSATSAELERYAADVDVMIAATTDESMTPSDGIDSIDGRRVLTSIVEDPPIAGVIEVTVSVDPEIGITGDGATRYFTLLALGTILLAIAAWTFFAERRSLERRATTDEMTGLLNRREFERQCEEAMINADRFRTGLCIMLVDLDGFKSINDTRGHQFGDRVLIETARRLRSAVRDTDVVGRWGGDEFLILLPGLEQGTAVRNSAERIAASLSGSPVVEDVTVTGSIGAALFPRHGQTFDDLIRAADGAMYAAKTTGVPHRLADAVPGDDPGGADESYEGPERRRTPSTGEPVA